MAITVSLALNSCVNSENKVNEIDTVYKDAKMQISELYDSEKPGAVDLRDSIVTNVLCMPGSFELPVDSLLSMPHYSALSEDGSVKLVTICGGGTMTTGVSYIQYKREDGTLGCRKIADAEQVPEGGVVFPACYTEIHKAATGKYLVLGTFSFGAMSDVVSDTLLIDSASLK